MIRNAFRAVCECCGVERDGCARCYVIGMNGYGQREGRVVLACAPCRKECRGRCWLAPEHATERRRWAGAVNDTPEGL